ncbi:GDYXXLXY domain-containing protein [Thiofilum flexile]|uniref:GDYXXLXY domain-containing protein n=1 Tax=Thiofilum flexile TaxID=125627 RepID=UPI000365E490|nr:GDYXXLXY domain-containing protein [Thiofilum flexile]
MKRAQQLALAIALPLALLTSNAAWHVYQLNQGVEIHLPIQGFDPRDLLAGHYLTYQVDYGLGDFCPREAINAARQRHTLCLHPKQSTATADCTLPLEGFCNQEGFKAGIERFYIPEQYADDLDKAIRGQKGEIVIMVKSGKATLKSLLIEHKPWLEFIQRNITK